MIFFGPAGFAQNPLTADLLIQKIQTDPRLSRVAGGLSAEEKAIINNKKLNPRAYEATRNAAIERFLSAYESDVVEAKKNAGNSKYTNPIRVEMMNELKAKNFDIENLTTLREQIQPANGGQRLVKSMRNNLRTTGKFAFAGADVLLLGVVSYKDAKAQEIKSQILLDAQNGRCPSDPSSEYVKMFVFEELEIQKMILSKCHPTDSQRLNSLTTKLQKKRDEYKRHFSNGRAQCLYENGKPIIYTVADSGTKQAVMFTEDGSFERLRILPQDEKYEGSYLDYLPDNSVTYLAVQKSGGTVQGPALDKKHMSNEPVNSFSARMYCQVNACTSQTPEFHAIRKDESLMTTPERPFGHITENKKFLIQSAKTLAQFRLGIQEDFERPMNFRTTCLSLGSVPPEGKGTAPITILNPVKTKSQTPDAAR